MIKILPKSNESIIAEEHLYPIMFGLKDVLEYYKLELETFKIKEYSDMTGEEIHLKKWYENKIYDTKKVLEEINLAIEKIED